MMETEMETTIQGSEYRDDGRNAYGCLGSRVDGTENGNY